MWLRELAGVASERGFTDQWTTIVTGTDLEYNALLPMHDRLDQFVLMMRRALYKSLDTSITVQLDPAIIDGTVEDNCRAIISYVKNKGEELAPALIEGSNEKLTKSKWGGSKVSLAAWVGKLRTIAGTCGEQLPAGVPRENAIRKLVMSNVGMRNPDCAQVIRSFQVKPVSQAGFTVDELVVQLTTVMIKSETGGERQCQVFAADIQDEKALHALLAQKDNTISQLKNSNANKNANQSAASSSAHPPQGGESYYGGDPQGNYRQNNYNRAGNDWGEQDWNKTDTRKSCHKCRKYYKDKGQEQEKAGVISSHYTGDCRWKQGGGGKGKGKGKEGGGGKGAKKGNDKKYEKKGGGKGKKGKGGGKKGKGKY